MIKTDFNSNGFISKEFDDIYFSKEDGEKETIFVFLEGNHLKSRWYETKHELFRIGELGFGTGLNFFVTKNLWYQTEEPPNIEFYSLEKFPLENEFLLKMKGLFPDFSTWDTDLLDSYNKSLTQFQTSPDENPIFEYSFHHEKKTSTFKLKLYFGEVLSCLKSWNTQIDAFYLDGFAPAKNSEMWSVDVMEVIKKLSMEGTTFATFTSAGAVKRNLMEIGFTVTKQKGFGRKREMLVGKFNPIP